MTEDKMLMRFINNLFPNGFSQSEEEYGVIYFKDNLGRGSKKISLTDKMDIEILDHAKALDANEVILVHSQPLRNLDEYPSEDDIALFEKISKALVENGIRIHNNACISKQTGEFKCTTFKVVGQPIIS